eukprot:6186323-Pleurochrysis_carterae.AAC.3
MHAALHSHAQLGVDRAVDMQDLRSLQTELASRAATLRLRLSRTTKPSQVFIYQVRDADLTSFMTASIFTLGLASLATADITVCSLLPQVLVHDSTCVSPLVDSSGIWLGTHALCEVLSKGCCQHSGCEGVCDKGCKALTEGHEVNHISASSISHVGFATYNLSCKQILCNFKTCNLNEAGCEATAKSLQNNKGLKSLNLKREARVFISPLTCTACGFALYVCFLRAQHAFERLKASWSDYIVLCHDCGPSPLVDAMCGFLRTGNELCDKGLDERLKVMEVNPALLKLEQASSLLDESYASEDADQPNADGER